MKKFFVIVVFFFCADAACAGVVIDKTDNRVFFGDKVEYYLDKDNLKLSEILKQTTGWQQSSLNSIIFGFTKAVAWVRFDIENNVGKELLCTFNIINCDYINFYILNEDGTYIEKTGGSAYPFNQREVIDKDVFFIIPEFTGKKTIYVRFTTNYLLGMMPEIVTRDRRVERVIDVYPSAVFSHGIFLALAIYHLLLFISSREKTYLFLVLLIASFQLYDLAHDGLGYMFLWQESVFFENMVIPLSIGLIGINSGCFIQLSIETKKNFRIGYWLINFCILAGVILVISSFTGDRRFNIAFTLSYAMSNALLTMCILFYTGIIKKNRSAVFLFMVYLLFEISNVIAISASNPGLSEQVPFLNDYTWILRFSKYARVLFVLIFSLVLTDKINMMKRDIEISEQNYKSMFNGTSEAICIIDKKTFIVTDVNRRMLELFKVSYDEVKGKTADYFSSMESGYTDEKVESIYRDILKDRTVYLEWYFKKSTGEKFWADVTVDSVFISGKKMLMLIIRDISDKKKAEEEKEKILQQLIQAQKMEAVGSLAGGLAHDFNNILTGILGSSTMAKRYLVGDNLEREKIEKYIGIIEDLSVKASEMVKQLLTITRKQELKFVPANLNRILKNVVEICLNSFPKSVSIETEYLDTRAMVTADVAGLEQVFLNIFVNASHALTIMRDSSEPEGGVISLKIDRHYADDTFCRTNQDAVKGMNYFSVSIQDNGCGIDQNVFDKIFDPFFTTKNEATGSGLGLSMVYTIVSRHKGLIKVYSEKGKGAAFIIYLPEDAGEKKIAVKAQPAVIKWHGKILIIDDEKIVRQIAGDILENSGYEVLTASDGPGGIEIYRENADNIDLVLLDMSMPGMSGLDTFIELKKIKPDIKAIMSSGFTMDERVKKAIEMGADDFIQKPYTDIQLSKAVYDVLVTRKD